MKLVNPAGRNMETFETEAYKRCVCSRDFDNTVVLNPGGPVICGCECSYGTANRNANRDLSGN